MIDEALSVGDFAFQAKCMRRLQKFIDGGGTLLFVSHDIVSVKKLCRRSIYLRHGHTRAIGPSEVVCEQYLAETNLDEGLASAATPMAAMSGAGAIRSEKGVERLSLESIESFRHKVAPFRRHTSTQCEFVGVELSDETGRPLLSAEWGQRVTAKIWLRANAPVEDLVVAFYLRDRLQVDLMGTNTEYEGIELRDPRRANASS